MKKLLFLSFICVVFAMFTNIANAQVPEPATKCCFYLEQMPDLHPAQWMPELDGARYHLNPVTDDNKGKVEYYYFRFENNCLEPDAKLSIDWEFFVNGIAHDVPLNATATSPRNLMNVEIEWFLPLINNLEFQGSGPLLSGRGLNAEKIFENINGVDRAVRTDFPGTYTTSPNGTLYGYFNPYNGTPRWYNFFYADFLEWACANNYLRVKITRYSYSANNEVTANFRLMERFNGHTFLDFYKPDQQQYMGGHAAINPTEIASFGFSEIDYSEETITVCAGEIVEVENGFFDSGEPAIFINNNAPDGDTQTKIVYFYKETGCAGDIEKVVEYTVIWKAIPVVEFIQPEAIEGIYAFCLEGKTTVDIELAVEPAIGDYTYFIKQHHRLLNEDNAPTAGLRIKNPGEYLIKGWVIDNESNCMSENKATVLIKAYELPNFEVEKIQDRETCRPDDEELNGIVQVTSTDGREYIYSWKKGEVEGSTTEPATEHTFVNLLDGEYTFYATFINEDGIECKIEWEETITIEPMPNALEASVDYDPILCNGWSTDVEITAENGTGEITYYLIDEEGELVDSNNEGTFPGILAGTYTYYVEDASGCVTEPQEFTIEEPDVLVITDIYIDEEIECYGEEATVIVEATGGTKPYTFYCFDEEGELVDTNDDGIFTLLAGSYTFQVIDDNECETAWGEQEALFEVEQPEELVITDIEVTDEILCNGGTATVTVTAEGGTGDYTYFCYELIADAEELVDANEDGIFELPVGFYIFKVMDENECLTTWEGLFEVEQPDELVITDIYVDEEIECYDGEAIVIVEADGGTEPYTFYCFDEEGELVSTNDDGIFTLPAGFYTFQVIDDNECETVWGEEEEAFEVEQPDLLEITNIAITPNPVLCKGDEATVTVTAAGGTEPYTFFCFDEEGELLFTNSTGIFTLSAGTYTFDVTDENECEAEPVERTITEPATSVEITDIEVTDEILCFGGTGTVTVTAEGGTGILTYYCYELDDEEELVLVDENEDGIFELPAGFYIFKVMDENECVAVWEDEFEVEQPDELEITEIELTVSISCHDEFATVTVIAGGGTLEEEGAYTYYCYLVVENEEEEDTLELIESNNIGVFTGLEPGFYTFIVEDDNECTATWTPPYEIVAPEPLEITGMEVTTTIKCFGRTGTITVTAGGGALPYTFYCFNAAGDTVGSNTTGVFAGLYKGTYTFKVVDNNDCDITDTKEITSPTELVITNIEITAEIECHGDATAAVEVSATGGTPGYDYQWFFGTVEMDANGTGIFEGLLAGISTFKVIDANECIVEQNKEITQPDKLEIDTVKVTVEIECYGYETATVVVEAHGGTGVITYYCFDAEGELVAENETGIFTDLGAGFYMFEVEDANGCVAVWEEEFEVEQPDELEIDEIDLETDPILCYGETGTVFVTATGGTVEGTYTYYCYDEEGELLFTNFDGEFTLPAGLYTFKVTDDNDCEYISGEIEVIEPPVLEIEDIDIETSPILCNGETGTVYVTATGGTVEDTYTYYCYDEEGDILFTNFDGIFTLPAGFYTFKVTDDNDCYYVSDEIEVEELELLTVEIVGDENICPETTTTLTAVAAGGDGNYTYLWSTGETTATISGLIDGTYTVTVTDGRDCEADDLFTITYYEDVTVTITAKKDCFVPAEIVVTSTEDATITIAVYSYNAVTDEKVQIDVIENIEVLANIPDTVYYPGFSGDADLIYFVATARVEDIDCDFVSKASAIVNFGDVPRLYAYEYPKNTNPTHPLHDSDNNEMEVSLEAPITHYFRIDQSCNEYLDLRLSVQYEYWYKAPGETDFIEIGANEISNYLTGAFMRYTTPMGACGSPVVYSHMSGSAYFPRPGSFGNGWFWETNQYDFFLLSFFHDREIKVELPGFNLPGTYEVRYTLVTHKTTGTGAPHGMLRNSWCLETRIGGFQFYLGNYYVEELAKRTMIIYVDTEKAPGLDITEIKVAAATVYPNPATDNIKIKVENIEGHTQVCILNVNGQIVLNQQFYIANDEVSIKLPDLNPGIYFVNIISKDAVLTRKLIIAPKF